MANERPLESGNKAVIDLTKCNPDDCLLGEGDYCLICMAACDIAEAISKGDDGFPVVDLDECSGCGSCTKECPQKAIEVSYLEGTEPPKAPPSRFVWA